jgi:AcrR family transcriptional regulator
MHGGRVVFASVQTPQVAEIIPLPLRAEGLPTAPPEGLDLVLDAAVECIARHGLAKTSLSDIAREMGVAPSTVYRKVGTVEHAAALVMAREGHRMLTRLPAIIEGIEGPRQITVFVAESIETVRRHPMMRKLLNDSDWVGRLVTRDLDDALERQAAVSAPLLALAMKEGHIRRQDPVALAHWLARISLICLFSLPPGDLFSALDALLLPVLEPEAGRGTAGDKVERARAAGRNRRTTRGA